MIITCDGGVHGRTGDFLIRFQLFSLLIPSRHDSVRPVTDFLGQVVREKPFTRLDMSLFSLLRRPLREPKYLLVLSQDC